MSTIHFSSHRCHCVYAGQNATVTCPFAVHQVLDKSLASFYSRQHLFVLGCLFQLSRRRSSTTQVSNASCTTNCLAPLTKVGRRTTSVDDFAAAEHDVTDPWPWCSGGTAGRGAPGALPGVPLDLFGHSRFVL